MRCLNCNAEIDNELEPCENCGMTQKEVAEAAPAPNRSSVSPNKQGQLILKGAALGILIAFILGVWAGAAIFGRKSPPPPSPTNAPQEQAQLATLEKQINAFVLRINNLLHLDIVSWFEQSDGSIVLEMARPTEDSPALWEALTSDEKRQIFEYLSAAFTTQVWQAGRLEGLLEGRFPVLILAYSKINRPIAVRDDAGDIHIYTSPYDSK